MSNQPESPFTGDVVVDRLSELLDKLALNDSRVRRSAKGGVHGMRVTIRRIRSLLASFGELYDEATVVGLRTDLKWVGGELGGARDAEVVRQRVVALARSASEDALAERVGEQLRQTEAAALAEGIAVLDSDRYSRTRSDLTAFIAAAQGREEEAPDEAELRRRVRRDWKRLRKRARAVDEIAGEAEHQEGVHEVRKAAKRLRYSAETLVPIWGEDASRLARRAKRVQSVLGEVQDSVVSQVRLRGLAENADWSRKELFLLGGFHAREELKAVEAEGASELAWQRLAKRKNRQWLS